ncbi:MAG: extracellular solute-binding protein [Oscillospiraceae bacterium]|nr:extracellular solute-binding protein [Oscillospiraceae bacterium]
MKLKKLLGFVIVTLMVLSLAAGCESSDNPPASEGNVTTPGDSVPGTPSEGTSENVRDLNGMEVTIGIFWAPDDSDPETDFGRARLAYLEEMQRKHNFTIKQVQIATQASMTDIVNASIITGNPAASICTLEPDRVISMHRQGMFFDVGSLSVDLHAEKWNRHIIEAMTFDGGIYGFVQGYNPWNAGVVFFNKNVLSEAGIDPESIYDLQAANEWTWDAMLNMALQVTRDIDNDGVPDYYGFCTFSRDTLVNTVFSNGGRFVNKDENGRFVNATHTNEFLLAAEWVHNLEKLGLLQPAPEGAAWNWWIEGFNEGRAAFRVHQDYSKSDMQSTTFDWGVVLFPRGPLAEKQMAAYYENINIIPKNFSQEEADDILFAYDLYTDPVPGFEDDDDAWKYGLFNAYRDFRSIDDTVEMLRTGDYTAIRYEFIIPGFTSGEIADHIWNLERTPAQLVDEASQEWNVLIDQANRWVFGDN